MPEFLKKFDQYGRTQLVIQKGSDYHPTKLGGVVSILQMIVILWLLFNHLETMIDYGKTHFEQYDTSTDFESLGEIKFNDVKAIPFFTADY